jgi:fructose-bisphosphate aldolase, class II
VHYIRNCSLFLICSIPTVAKYKGVSKMYEYEEYGFVNTDEMFKKAYEGGYAVPAFNYVNLEQMLAIVEACIETRSPFILQSSANVNHYIGPIMVKRMAQACAEIIAESGTNVPMALNLDHGVSLKQCMACA